MELWKPNVTHLLFLPVQVLLVSWRKLTFSYTILQYKTNKFQVLRVMPSVVKHMHSFLFPVVLLGFGFFGTSLAAAPSTEYSVKEEIILPRNWVKLSQPSSDHDIHLRIGLKQSNFHVLERILYEVSDPYHEHYGQHLSKSEVEALVAPRPESLNLVNEWLSSFGVNEDSLVRSPAKDWITLKVSVGLAEKMLDTVSFLIFTSLVLQSSIHFCRPIMSGSILRAMITWSGLQVIVFLAIFMIISTSFNPRRCSDVSNSKNWR